MNITDEMLYECAPKAEKLWLDILLSANEQSVHEFSGRFERKMKKLIREQRRSPRMNKIIRVSKRVALIALAILTVSFSCLMCVEAYRERFIGVITEIFEDLTQFFFLSAEAEEPRFGDIIIGYLPDGMVEIDREDNPEACNRFIYYKNTEGHEIVIEQDVIISNKQASIIVDTENMDVSTVEFNGHSATLIIKGNYTTLMWEDAVFAILVSGDFPLDEMVKVASGIQIS